MNARHEYAGCMQQVATLLLGEPTERKAKELRYGTRGSLSIDLESGVWRDHEAGTGGGVLALIERETGNAGRAAVEWMEAIGITAATDNAPAPRKRFNVVAAYDYYDADGVLQFQVCRMDPKDFRQRRPDGKGGWSWSVKGVEQVPYRLPQMLARPDEIVFVVEGEKDADNLAALDLLATCNAGGANKWHASLSQHFRGRDVVILPDSDDAGRAHARLVTHQLQGIAASVRVLALPDLPHKGDVSDWLAAGHGAAELVAMTNAAPVVPVLAHDDVPVAFDAHTPLPHVSGGGRPKATIENVAEILRRMRASVRYNVIGKRNEFTIPGESFAIDNAENDALARVESRCAEAGMPTGSLPRIVSYLAGQNQYNPAATWILSRPWDGVSRLQDFYATVTPQEVKTLPDGRQLHQVLMLRWMLSAVAAAFEPNGVSAHGVLVLQGEQYLGKTKWFKSLVPDDLGLTKEGMILRPDDKDSVKQACSFFLVELGELDATFRKSDISALKSFITNQSDVLRLPYARGESHFARRTVFFGSVNPREFLHDTSGNRRYWTIECKAIDHSHQLDMQQIFAEVHALYQAGERHYLTPDEHVAMNASNESFQVADTIEERLQAKLDWSAPQAEWTWRTATEILMETGIDRPNRDEASKAGAALRKLNGGHGKRSNGKTALLAPPLPGRNTGNWERPF
ncbi:VapE domain-containing protein [Ralstonia solanacearum species complex bacterium KE056]|uniref:VapE domain-containing protein n=1 Tax=Ralstonia solanacearum species complex bacterium KE056 TaxID=3119585 RepID=UPI002FC2A152